MRRPTLLRRATAGAVGALLFATAACGSRAVVPEDPAVPQQWGLAAISAPEAWATSTGSADVRVAVIDAGVDPVPDLAPNLAPGVRCRLECEPGATADPDGHGTAVASVLGSVGDNGVALAGVFWRGRVVPISVADESGEVSVDAVTAAVRWAAAQGIRVVALPLTLSGDHPALAQAIAAAPGTLVVVPAGNDGLDVDATSLPVQPCVDPSANVLCVAGSDGNGELDRRSNRGRASVDLVAPSVDLPASDRQGRVVRVSGTSFAVPMAAGVAALLASAQPDATTSELVRALRCGAERGPASDGMVGAGSLDAAGALRVLAQDADASGDC